MKPAVFAVTVLLAACLVRPADVAATHEKDNWRKRASSENEIVAISDISEEVRFGREVAARIIARYGLYDNPKIMKYVNLVGQSLARNTNRPELDFHFAVLKGDEINAFAAPGGYIFVTQGALRQMRDEAELAGVLAHELGHVTERHAVKELHIHGVDDSAVSGLAKVIGGSTDTARVAFAQAVDKAMDLLFKDGYKREDETQADKDAVLFCAMAGYDPSGLVRYFTRINEIKGKQTEVIDKTHPPFRDRIDWLKAAIDQEGVEPTGNKAYTKRFKDSMSVMK
jgi:beta-barrel assembly-enhancing protease